MLSSYTITVTKYHVSCDYCKNDAFRYEDLDAFMSELDLAGWEFADCDLKSKTLKPVLDDLKTAHLQFCSKECLLNWCKARGINQSTD